MTSPKRGRPRKPQLEPRTCPTCGKPFTPGHQSQVYCGQGCWRHRRWVPGTSPASRLTPAEILSLEELSDANLRTFYEGTPREEMPAGARRRLDRIGEANMKTQSPVGGTEPAPETGRRDPRASRRVTGIEEALNDV